MKFCLSGTCLFSIPVAMVFKSCPLLAHSSYTLSQTPPPVKLSRNGLSTPQLEEKWRLSGMPSELFLSNKDAFAESVSPKVHTQQRAHTFLSHFKRWWCHMYVTLQAVVVLHLCHTSGSGGVTFTLQAVVVLHLCHTSGSGGVTFTLQAVALSHVCHTSSGGTVTCMSHCE
jgi:hypothetical protein